MIPAKYDQVGDFYLKFVEWGLANEQSLYSQTSQHLLKMADDVTGLHILDLCCGEGHLSKQLAKMGGNVTGIDISAVNISAARKAQAGLGNPSFLLDNAQTLGKIQNNLFDLVICKMALMDIPDLDATFKSVKRVLKHGGRFLTAMLHPCFETPFNVPFKPIEQNDAGEFRHHRVQRYFDEGLWHSGGDGVRGKVGAHHRTLSSVFNSFLAAGFQITQLQEPQFLVGSQDSLEHQWSQQIPRILFFEGMAT